jgi:hypothetical protein
VDENKTETNNICAILNDISKKMKITEKEGFIGSDSANPC